MKNEFTFFLGNFNFEVKMVGPCISICLMTEIAITFQLFIRDDYSGEFFQEYGEFSAVYKSLLVPGAMQNKSC